MIDRPHRPVAALAAVLALAAAAWAAPAAAEERPRPEDVAAASVYRETIPSSAGPTVVGSRPGGVVPLTAAAASALGAAPGPDAALLGRVATSPAYGVPDRSLRPPDDGIELPSDAPAPGALAAIAAAPGAAAGTTTGRLLGLAIGLLLVTVTLATVAARRRAHG